MRARSVSLSLAVAAALGCAPLPVWAAGLGSLTVQSGLGQTLRAEVAITALGDTDVASLNVGLASPEAFRKAGLDFNPALSSLRFAIEPRSGGGALVRVTSTQPVNEPFVDLMLELTWDSGRFVREYTFLLDPPELRLGQDAVVAGGSGHAVVPAPAAGAVSAQQPTGQRPSAIAADVAPAGQVAERQAPASPPAAPAVAASAQPVSGASTAVQTAASSPARPPAAARAPSSGPADRAVPSARPAAPRSGTVRVESGDTASSIAARIKPADVTLEQAVIALYRANPEAFFGSVHQLRAGRNLSVPGDDAIRAVDPGEARAEIRTQLAAFNAWRSSLAASVPTVETASAGQSVTGAVSAPAEEKAAAADSGDRLELSRTDATPDGAGGSVAPAARASAEESRVAQQAALSEQQERVALLERNVADLQQLLELKNRQLAELQQQVEAAHVDGASVSGTVDARVADGGSVPRQASADTEAPAGTDSSAGAGPSAASDVAADHGASSAKGGPSTSGGADGTTQGDRGAAKPSAADGGGVLDRLTGHPWAWPVLIAAALILGLAGLLARRRRRRTAEFEDSFADVDAFATNSLFGTTGGQSIDTHASVFAPGAAPHAAAAPMTEVDPVAEADVYIAYGREEQAEEILREALQNQPQRQEIRLKLLEMHAARRDVAAFGALAQEMYDQTAGANEEWPRVVALGREIDPDNPLYGDSRGAGTSADFASVPVPDEPDEAPAGSVSGFLAGAPSGVSFDPDSATVSAAVSKDPLADVSRDDEVPALDFDFDLEPEAETTVGRAGLKKTGQFAPALSTLPGAEPDGAADGSALERAIGGAFELPSLDVGADVLDEVRAGVGQEDASAEMSGRAGVTGLMQPDRDREAGRPLSRAAADEALDFDIDLPTFGDLDVRDSRIDRPAVDLADLGADADTGEFGVPTLDFDLTGIDTEMAAAAVDVPSAGAQPRWQEMDTKLDLAAAYEEIGDKEGARELLQEVLEGGDADQQDKARSMLATIG